ncbi:MAG: glycogen synthase GlgA [Candidatus Binatia bacterium]
MRIVLVASEAQPYAKTGGLGDVLAALPRALAALGVDVTVCLPAYRSTIARAGPLEPVARVRAPISSRLEAAEVLRVANDPLPTFLFRADRYFDRDGLYGTPAGPHPDNAERFAFFSRAVLEWLRTCDPSPDVVHAHDWQTALVPAFLRATAELYPELAAVRSLLTIHNLAYQGRFWALDWHLLNLDRRLLTPDFLEFHGDINFLKAGLLFADRITTVSPRYAAEIQTEALGQQLDGVLRARRDALVGILNGVDYGEWDPATDPHLPVRYDAGTLPLKARCKTALLAEMGLAVDPGTPLLVVVSRLVDQKGIDLILAVAPALVTSHGVALAILGSGDARYEEALRRLAATHRGRIAVRIGFDEALAHRMEAGGDVFLMPSRFEPCGLNQMYSLRYGTVPVVHATGGLDDTVVEFDPRSLTGTGFKFRPHAPAAFLDAIRRALATRRDARAWARLQANGMAQDFSWERAAREYIRLYRTLARR